MSVFSVRGWGLLSGMSCAGSGPLLGHVCTRMVESLRDCQQLSAVWSCWNMVKRWICRCNYCQHCVSPATLRQDLYQGIKLLAVYICNIINLLRSNCRGHSAYQTGAFSVLLVHACTERAWLKRKPATDKVMITLFTVLLLLLTDPSTLIVPLTDGSTCTSSR